MAPRRYWKGYLRLPLVSCPIQLFPATSERGKICFNQINKQTGNRKCFIKLRKWWVIERGVNYCAADGADLAFQMKRSSHMTTALAFGK